MEDKKNRYIIVGTGEENSILNEAFYEVRNNMLDNAAFTAPYSFNSRILKKLYNLRYKQRNRKYLRFLPNSIWDGFSVLNRLSIAQDETVYILFVIGRDVERLISPTLLKRLKKKYGERVCTVLVLFDAISVTTEHTGWGTVRNYFDLFDKVATFDLGDANEYNLIHFHDPYRARKIKTHRQEKSDLFFIGVDKGRYRILEAIAEKATSEGLKCDFRIYQPEKIRSDIGINKLDKFLPYDQMLTYMDSSQCIVEVLADGQASSSYRYYEAVVYNKKLLTNNVAVKTMPLYNSKYIRYFDIPENIDFGFIKDDTAVDYGYKDEFSIVHLFNKIEKG